LALYPFGLTICRSVVFSDLRHLSAMILIWFRTTPHRTDTGVVGFGRTGWGSLMRVPTCFQRQSIPGFKPTRQCRGHKLLRRRFGDVPACDGLQVVTSGGFNSLISRDSSFDDYILESGRDSLCLKMSLDVRRGSGLHGTESLAGRYRRGTASSWTR